jgi:hypothetical protein
MLPKSAFRLSLGLILATLLAMPSAAFAAPMRGESTLGDFFDGVREWVLMLWPTPSPEVRSGSRLEGNSPASQPNLHKRGCSIDPDGQANHCV